MDELDELHELQFFSVIDTIAHPIFVKDRAYRWVLVNRAFCELLARTRDELIGKTDYDYFPKEQADFFRAKDVEMFTTRLSVQVDEEPMTDGAGAGHVLATTKVPLFGANGEVTHLVGIIHDITRLKAAEEELRITNQELERRVEERTSALQRAQLDLLRKEKLTELGKLAGGVAHEIRNPLSAINNAAYVLERQLSSDLSPDAAAALAIIHEEVRRANHIVSDLLDYARVREPNRRPVLTSLLIEAAIRAADVPGEVGVRVPKSDRPPSVMVDATQCEAALSNVLRNSVEAMHGHGEITIEEDESESSVFLRVRDNGPGVATEVENRLFEPLVTTKVSGLGLGLVTARTLVEGQGGTLTFERKGETSSFVIKLPRMQPRPEK
ncbi:MAG TPA: PAS domain-containing protein [Polyangiaceae bacterium]